MNWFMRLRVVTKREQSGRELDEELQFHLDHQIEENLAAGMPPREARLAALREFGLPGSIKEECRSSRGVDWVDNICQDVRYALRSYRRKPGFALAVVSLMAVGIGATTAVFSFADRVLFRDLPYAGSAQLVSLGIRIPWLEFDFLTANSYAELRRNPGPLAELTSWSGVSDCDVTGAQPLAPGLRPCRSRLPSGARRGAGARPELHARGGSAQRAAGRPHHVCSVEEPLRRRARRRGPPHRSRWPARTDRRGAARGFRAADARSLRPAAAAGAARQPTDGHAPSPRLRPPAPRHNSGSRS